MTALSYSLTTLTVTRRLRGKVTRTRRSDRMVIRMAHRPGQSDEHLVTKNNVINDKYKTFIIHRLCLFVCLTEMIMRSACREAF